MFARRLTWSALGFTAWVLLVDAGVGDVVIELPAILGVPGAALWVGPVGDRQAAGVMCRV